jgi:hypothetical protein
MKYFGGLLLIGYVAVSALGIEPFTREERVAPGGTRRTTTIWPFFWNSGYRGGK